MPQVRLKFKPAESDDQQADLSTDVPHAEFKRLASHSTDNGVLGILELQSSDANAIIRRFKDEFEVSSLDVLHTDGRIVLIPLPEGSGLPRGSLLNRVFR